LTKLPLALVFELLLDQLLLIDLLLEELLLVQLLLEEHLPLEVLLLELLLLRGLGLLRRLRLLWLLWIGRLRLRGWRGLRESTGWARCGRRGIRESHGEHPNRSNHDQSKRRKRPIHGEPPG